MTAAEWGDTKNSFAAAPRGRLQGHKHDRLESALHTEKGHVNISEDWHPHSQLCLLGCGSLGGGTHAGTLAVQPMHFRAFLAFAEPQGWLWQPEASRFLNGSHACQLCGDIPGF